MGTKGGEGPRVAVVGTRYGTLDIEEGILSRLGCRLVAGDGASASAIVETCRGAQAVLAGGSLPKFTAEVIAQLDGCKIIARYGIGYDNIDTEAARRRGIAVTNVPDYCIDEVSDHAMAFILAFARKLETGAAEVRDGGWGIACLRPIRPLRGATLGILAIGRIGSALARKARAFGMRILAHDPFASADAFLRIRAEKTTLNRLLREADYLSLHAPLTPKTRGMIGAPQIARMKPEAVLINVARGELVDEATLAAALREGRLRGAALDVFSQEPPGKNHPLIGLPNSLVTPHSAWYSATSQATMRRRAAEEVLRVLRGRLPKNRVN